MSWISGSCDDNDDEPVIIAFTRELDYLDEWLINPRGDITWIDGGSGPGYEVPPFRRPDPGE